MNNIKKIVIINGSKYIYTNTIKNTIIDITKYSQKQLVKLNKLPAHNKQIQLTFSQNSDIFYANALQFKTYTLDNLKNILLNADINQIYSVSKIEYKSKP